MKWIQQIYIWLEISKNTHYIFLAQITRKFELFLENGGFKRFNTAETAIIGGKLNIYAEHSEIAFNYSKN